MKTRPILFLVFYYWNLIYVASVLQKSNHAYSACVQVLESNTSQVYKVVDNPDLMSHFLCLIKVQVFFENNYPKKVISP